MARKNAEPVQEWWCINRHRNRGWAGECGQCGTTMRGREPSEYTTERKVFSASERAAALKTERKRADKASPTDSESEQETSTPACPTCRSRSIKRLTLAARGLSGVTGGILFSRRARAHFTCRDCGYNW